MKKILFLVGRWHAIPHRFIYSLIFPRVMCMCIARKIFQRMSAVLYCKNTAAGLRLEIISGSMRIVSINHRIAEFLASYFDVIFAINELTHPGEKRLMAFCERQCEKLPADFRRNMEQLFCDMYGRPENISGDIDAMISGLEKTFTVSTRDRQMRKWFLFVSV